MTTGTSLQQIVVVLVVSAWSTTNISSFISVTMVLISRELATVVVVRTVCTVARNRERRSFLESPSFKVVYQISTNDPLEEGTMNNDYQCWLLFCLYTTDVMVSFVTTSIVQHVMMHESSH